MSKKIIIPINGMHCKSCELLVEEELNNLKGICEVKVDCLRGEAVIFCENNLDPDIHQISEAIKKAGYSIGQNNEATSFFSKNKKHYKELGLAFLCLIGVYFLLKGFGLTEFSLETSSGKLTYSFVLLVGLTAGISTCMALVGGLILGVSARYNKLHPEATVLQRFRPHLFFNFARVLCFFILGGVLGLLGSVFQLSSIALGILTIVIGLIMFVIGLQLIEIFPWIGKLKFTLPKFISKKFGAVNYKKEYSHKNSMILGALSFFLPCGFTQAMQVYAVGTGSFWGGALVMSIFALGTVPGLLSIGGITAAVKGGFARGFFKFSGLVVIIFAVLNISNGLGLAGLYFSLVKTAPIASTNLDIALEDGFQVIRMTENSQGYSPNNFTIKKNIPVKWIIQADAPYSCASSILLSKYNIRKNLVAGENIIEFTPTEAGTLRFSCFMGMYAGSFNVE